MTKKKESKDPLEDLVVRYAKAPQGGTGDGPEALVRKVALRLKDRVTTRLTKTGKARLEGLLEEEKSGKASQDGTVWKPPRKPGEPPPGNVLSRTWHGQEIRVAVLQKGYQWNDQVFKSLSAVARAVTNARWNGRLFFGLVKRQRKAK
jgi:hypothetical protein